MAWIPAFKPGLWNVWLLMLIVPLLPIIFQLADKMIGTGDILSRMGSAPVAPTEKRLNQIYMILLVVLGAYSIFLPLRLGTGWFPAGLSIYAAGLALLLSAMAAAVKTPKNQFFSRGVYRVSRHPMYLAMVTMFAGAGIASESWLFLLLTGGMAYLMAAQVNFEETACLSQFGRAYRQYLRKTPRWIGVPRKTGQQ